MVVQLKLCVNYPEKYLRVYVHMYLSIYIKDQPIIFIFLFLKIMFASSQLFCYDFHLTFKIFSFKKENTWLFNRKEQTCFTTLKCLATKEEMQKIW